MTDSPSPEAASAVPARVAPPAAAQTASAGAAAGADADAAPGLSLAELTAWLAILETPGIGRTTARRLLSTHGGPQAVLAAGLSDLRLHLGQDTAQALLDAPQRLAALIETTWKWLRADPTHHILTLADAAYPPLLLECGDPPLLLYARGRLEALQRPAIAVVGSRSPTAAGAGHARDFSAAFVQAGQVVVSGMALGIDAAAHEGALRDLPEGEPAGAPRTIAVIGTGIDRVYPRRHRELAHRIIRHGLMLTEFALGTPALAPNFPMRNRLIAGLSRGTLVVEAALQSGSLITARLATEMGRDVFAIPGSIHSPLARGCHALIKQGAKLVESVQDVFDEWSLADAAGAPAVAPPGAVPARRAPGAARADGQVRPAAVEPTRPQRRGDRVEDPDEAADDPAADLDEARTDTAAAPAHARPAKGAGRRKAAAPDFDLPAQTRLKPVLDALGYDPVSLDELLDRTGLDIGVMSAYLLEMELEGLVERLPGQQFQRIGSA